MKMKEKKYCISGACFRGKDLCCAHCELFPRFCKGECGIIGVARYCPLAMKEEKFRWNKLLGIDPLSNVVPLLRNGGSLRIAKWRRRARTFREIVSLKDLFK